VETIHPKARKRVDVVSDVEPLSLFADGKASSVSLGAACRAGTAAPQHESVSPSVSVCRDTDGAPHSVSFEVPAPGPERMVGKPEATRLDEL
jgi:hypothetical protein